MCIISKSNHNIYFSWKQFTLMYHLPKDNIFLFLEILYMVIFLMHHKQTRITQIWHILFISWDLWPDHHQIIPNIIFFVGNYFPSLYQLPKNNTFMCFGNTLHGCIIDLPQINHQKRHILFISGDIWLQHHQIIPNILNFYRKLFTLLYHLPKNNTFLCFGNTLYSFIVGLPEIKHQKRI